MGDFDWVCACRPSWDLEKEKEEGSGEEDDDEDEDEDDEEGSGHSCRANCKVNQLVKYHPEYPLVTTLLDADRFRFWIQQQRKRDQDDFDMHFYDDVSVMGRSRSCRIR